MERISAVVITKNEAGHIADCLASVPFADDVVVVDSGSTDATEEICRRDPRVRFFREPWKGYGPQKNSAAEKAAHRWVFSIDADERATPELVRAIAGLDLASTSFAAFRVARRSYFGERWIRHGGWYPDSMIRLWRKDRGRFDDRSVHESVRTDGPVGTLGGDLLHYTYRDTADFLERMNRYSTLGARELRKAGRRARLSDLVLRPPFTFLRMYVLKAGFLDGAAGFKLAALYAAYTFAKYAKLGERDDG